MGDITTAMKNTYARNLMHLSQQKFSRLRKTVVVKTLEGEKHFLDQFGARTPTLITTRGGDSPLNKQDFQRRMLTMKTYDDGDLLDKPDIIATIDDPTNPIAVAMAMGFGRNIDDVLIDAMSGTAFSGKDGTTSNDPDATNRVPSDYVETGSDTASGLTLAKIRRAKKILDAFEVDDDDEDDGTLNRFAVISADQVQNLLADTTYGSSDYNMIRPMVDGKAVPFLGFTFIRSQRLTLVTSTDIRTCLFYHRTAMVLGIGKEAKVDIDPARSDKRFNPYLYNAMTLGAVRMEEKKMVEVFCDESP